MKCGGFSEERKNPFLVLVAKSFPQVRKDWGWGRIIPIAIGVMSSVDRAGRGKTSCSAAQARGGARMKTGISWPQVRLHNPSLLPALHPAWVPHPLCHLGQLWVRRRPRSDPARSLGRLLLHRAGMARSLLLSCFHPEPGDGPDQCSCVLWHCSWPNKHSCSTAGSVLHTRVEREPCGVAGVLGMW